MLFGCFVMQTYYRLKPAFGQAYNWQAWKARRRLLPYIRLP